MATLLQKNLAKNIVENAKASKKKNKKELLVSSGYALKSATQSAGMILEQKGVVDELENLGFSEEGAKKVVQSILYDKRVKADTRINAAKEVFKVTGAYAPDKHININVTPIYAGKSIDSLSGHVVNEKDIPAQQEDTSG